MTSREYIHNLKNKPVLDERLFNNYCEQKPDLVHTSEFSKRQGKKLDNRLKHMNGTQLLTQISIIKLKNFTNSIITKKPPTKPKSTTKPKGSKNHKGFSMLTRDPKINQQPI